MTVFGYKLITWPHSSDNSFSTGQTIRKLMHGAGKVPKKYSRKRKLKDKKIHARQLTLNIIMVWPQKKIHTKNLITKKIPHHLPPITFLMVRP